jgi:hypothetical protein
MIMYLNREVMCETYARKAICDSEKTHTVIQFDLELANPPLTLPFPSPLPTTGFLQVIMKVIRYICRTQFL